MIATKTKTVPVDIIVHNHGSVIMVQPLTKVGRTWVEEYVTLEDWQWMGSSFAVEPRYLDNLVQGMRDDGLTVK